MAGFDDLAQLYVDRFLVKTQQLIDKTPIVSYLPGQI
jgi:hypothetical protein